jgi:hypothetical protein
VLSVNSEKVFLVVFMMEDFQIDVLIEMIDSKKERTAYKYKNGNMT